MPYELKRYNNDKLVTVPDSSSDSETTSLKFIGKNYAGYGADQNENFLYLLENFARGTAPQYPITGQIWYDSSTKKLKYYDESIAGTNKWRTTGGSYIGTVDPSQTNSLNIGDLWFDERTKQLKTWDGSTFVLVGPQAVFGSSTTNLESVSITDSLGGSRTIIKALIDGTVMFIISKASFTIGNSNAISGFTDVHEGITLRNSTTGITDPSASTRLWGTASDSDKLNGLPSSDYILKANASFSALAAFPNAGITIGTPAKIKIFVDESNSNLGTIQNLTSGTLSIKVKNTTTNDTLNPIVVSLYNVNPGAHQTYDLGTDALQWNKLYAKDIYASTFHGTVTGIGDKSNTLYYERSSLSGDLKYSSATDVNTGNTIVARDSSGNFAANIITAIATQARYADLAEKYDADAEYDPGTVVVFGGTREITVTNIEEDTRVAGVISTNPAYLMNNDSDGLAVALRGKVPCKVVGPVKKGNILVSSSVSGCAMASSSNNPLSASIIGKSLEDKFDSDFGIIMIVVT